MVDIEVDGNESLRLTRMPPLWPLPHPHFANYASAPVNLEFGWKAGGFEIRRFNIARTRVLHRAPLTEEGWSNTWQVMVSEYPQLAIAVASKSDLGEASKQKLAESEAYRVEFEALEMIASLPDCVLLGGYGYDDLFVAGTRCRLNFMNEGLWVTMPNQFVPRIRSPYKDTKVLEFSGPGRVRKGGGFFGGGFGPVGAVEGMIVASVLNSLTTQTTIQSIVRWEADSLEAFFFTSEDTPSNLRIKLSPVLGRIKPQFGIPRGSDTLSDLERLVTLHQQGALDDDEFAELKRRIISDA